MWTSDIRLIAPWTPEQVASLNEYQATVSTGMRYLCELKGGAHRPLVAEETKWVCPDCDYRAYWCYDVSANQKWREFITKPSTPMMGGWYGAS